MDELEGAEELRWDRDLAPVFRATLEGLDANGAGVEVDVLGAQGEDLEMRGAGVSQGQREGLVGGLPGACGGWRKRARSSVVRYFRPRESTRRMGSV